MTLTTAAVGTALDPTTFTWTPTEAILYALGVGARPPDELSLLDEHQGPAVLPTFALLANWWAVKDLRGVLGLGEYPIVHGGQSLKLARPLEPAGEVKVTGEVSAVWDKGKHGAIEVTTRGIDSGGELFVAVGQIMVLGGGGFGGDRGPATPEEPEGNPDYTVDDDIRPEQAAIYRLSGDRNPLHIDPVAARSAGFDDVFLHGLCTLGFAARALINGPGGGDPRALQSISCRFAKPVMPGKPLRTQIWNQGTQTHFSSVQGPAVALAAGTATLAG
ncbi:MaoC/PaaZ C-terminal domain-containing protein [Mycolicibacterium sp. 050232]|uniref:MaoC/PaaZ C-terminal domain-containing protein n=1 Tax=Mycolicibacterium sp. 050232 TaxID=3113982 RepID=UPI002E29A899|nr:MaoC/PaaZ C-terminal domain-containing protein [Mycolicibacterium sp. 050232]MED5810881.1 MaoC/PaaZ C-terminal domain-containing protein [Mycolicibacterium sp. 050232]